MGWALNDLVFLLFKYLRRLLHFSAIKNRLLTRTALPINIIVTHYSCNQFFTVVVASISHFHKICIVDVLL